MSERRGSRFVVEALFLAALTVALALAHLGALEIVGAMALGWLVVAAIEWTAWRGEPHYGSGLPPRYYLPRVELPPPQPLEQVVQGYPGSGRDDAPTWIASASLRAEVLGEWPLVTRPAASVDDHEPEAVFAPPGEAEDPWSEIALPPTPDARAAGQFSDPDERIRRESRVTQASWYTLDPLGDPAPKRRFRRDARAEGRVSVPARPARRALPGSR